MKSSGDPVYEASQQTEIVVSGNVALVQASKANHVPAVPKDIVKAGTTCVDAL